MSLLAVVITCHGADLMKAGVVGVVEISQITKHARPVGEVLDQLDLHRACLRDTDVDVHCSFGAPIAAAVLHPRHDVERSDSEHLDPAARRSQQIVDDETELEHPVFAFGPGLLEKALRHGLSGWHG